MSEAYTSISHTFDPKLEIKTRAFTLNNDSDKIHIIMRQPDAYGHSVSLALTPAQISNLVEFLHKVQTQVFPFDVES